VDVVVAVVVPDVLVAEVHGEGVSGDGVVGAGVGGVVSAAADVATNETVMDRLAMEGGKHIIRECERTISTSLR